MTATDRIGGVMRRRVVLLAGPILAVLAWLMLAPPWMGGRTTVLRVHGESMEPALSAGDLALVRRAPSYGIGDVVAYRDANGSVILHRITGIDGAGYVLKGDANDWLDEPRPTQAGIIGRLWIHLPYAGQLASARPIAGAAGVVLVALMLFKRGRNEDGETAKGRPMRAFIADRPDMVRRGAAALLAAGALLAVVAFGAAPTASQTESLPYRHSGRFTYAAEPGASEAYPSGAVRTGDPLFHRIVDQVRLAFLYEAEGARSARGTGSFEAVLRDEITGWSTTFAVGPDVRLHRAGAVLAGTLDLRQLERRIARLEDSVGMRRQNYRLELRPRIDAVLDVDGHPVKTTFAPALAFRVEDLALWLENRANAATEDPLTPSQSAGVPVTRPVVATLGLGALDAPVPAARAVALVAIVAGLIALLAARAGRRHPIDELAELATRYAGQIVRGRVQVAGRAQVDVAQPEDLVAIAEARNLPLVLDETARALLLVDGPTVFRYAPASATREPLPVPAMERVAIADHFADEQEELAPRSQTDVVRHLRPGALGA